MASQSPTEHSPGPASELGVVPGVLGLLGMAPAGTETSALVVSSGTATSGWWWTTILSVSAVIVCWIVTSAVLRLGSRLRWIGAASRLRLSRIIQVGFGAILLAAMLLPYLLAHAPTAALIFCLVLAALTFPFIGGAADSQQFDSEPPTY